MSSSSSLQHRNERRQAVLLIPSLDTSRVLWLAQGLGKMVPRWGTTPPSGRGAEDVLLMTGARQNLVVCMALLLVSCLEEPTSAGVPEKGRVGSWFVTARGLNAHVDELMRCLVSSPVGLKMIREPSTVCLMREMCGTKHMRSRAHIVAAALLRVSDVLLTPMEGVAAGECGGGSLPLLVLCFTCVSNAVVMQKVSLFGSVWCDLLSVLDLCLLVASESGHRGLGFLRDIDNAGSLGRLRAFLDGVIMVEDVVGDAERVGVVYRLRTRLLLVMAMLAGDDAGTDDDFRESSDDCPTPPSIHDVEDIIDVVLFRDEASFARRTPGGVVDCDTRSPHDNDYLAYITWIACTALFHPNLPVFHPNPLSYSKILCQALEYRETLDHGCFPLVAWVLASRVVEAAEQRVLLAMNTSESGHRKLSLEHITGSASTAAHEWVETQMRLVGNKLAVDDSSRQGIVVGQAQEATLRTIRNLLFPCALFCPYLTLHKVFRMSTANRNDAWMLVAVCDLFPDLVNLPALGVDGVDRDDGARGIVGDHLLEKELKSIGELGRLLVHDILSGDDKGVDNVTGGPRDNESFLFAARSLLQSDVGKALGEFGAACRGNTGDSEARNHKYLWDCLPSLLRAPPDRLELATDFVLDVVRSEHTRIDRRASSALISICLSLLDFDHRYCSYGRDPLTFTKRALDNARKIVEMLLSDIYHDDNTELFYQILSEIETSGSNPWARLFFGIDFSEYEAHYILHTNPKPSQGLIDNMTSVKNICLHQTLELAALGSVQRAELRELASGYSSMEQFLGDLQASIRCLFSVCTSTEVVHLMAGLEIFCSTLLIREASWATNDDTGALERNIPSPLIASACSTAMVVELCLKATTRDLEPCMIPDICQYCVSLVEAMGIESTVDSSPLVHASLTARLFSELINHYKRRLQVPSDAGGDPKSKLPSKLNSLTLAALEAAISVLYRHGHQYHHQKAKILHDTFSDAAIIPEFILALQST